MSEISTALRRSLSESIKIDQGMLRYVLDQSRDCIKILDDGGRVTYINSEGGCALHIDDVDAVYGKPWTNLWPDESKAVIESVVAKARAGESSEFEACRRIRAARRNGGASACLR